MLICERPRFIFVHVWKTGGTSIAACLEPALGLEPRRGVVRRLANVARRAVGLPVLGKHSYAVDIRAQLGAAYDRHFRFGFVRNPWDWLVSWHKFVTSTTVSPDTGRAWRHHLFGAIGDMSFDRFVPWVTEEEGLAQTYLRRHSLLKSRTPVLQRDWLADFDGRLIVDFVGRFERLAEDFAEASRRIGLPPLELPHVNKSRHAHYRDLYNRDTRDAVARYFAADIDMFEYQF